MSRIGKRPIPVPSGVSVEIKDRLVKAKGPKGELSRVLPGGIEATLENNVITVTRPNDEERNKALHGLSRTLVANLVEGVHQGYEKVLEIQGVGYKAELKGTDLVLTVGLSHTVTYPAPAGIGFTVENNTVVKVAGANKELVGQVAAELRQVRPPEPYKGKGVRYRGERVRRKAGKTGAK
ncbi:MAG: 50S ribosomal protein L6 [Gemmatimonadales bacterium]